MAEINLSVAGTIVRKCMLAAMSTPRFADVRGLRSLRRLGLVGGAALLSACAQPQVSAPVASAPPEASQAPAVEAGAPVQAALLLPQSTSDAYSQEEAREILEAARFAEQQNSPLVNLRVYDTGGTQAGAAAAARRAAAEGADVILGPLRRDTTEAVRPVAEEAGLTVLSFSSDVSVGGPPIWLLGDLPENEVERVLGYAASAGVDSVAVVRPADDYGQVVESATRRHAPRYGISVTGALSYERSFEGVQSAINAGASGLRAGSPDAVLIAEGDTPLRSVASFLAYNDIVQPQTQYLGTAFWDTPEAPREALLHGGWFAAPEPGTRTAFVQAFEARTGQAPGRRAALGYDAVEAAAELTQDARARGDTTPFDAQDIATAGAFEGAGGIFHLTPEGGNRRALAVYEVTPGGFETRDPAGLVGAGS